LEDVPRPSRAKLRRRHKLDAEIRAALKEVLRRWPKRDERPPALPHLDSSLGRI